MEGDEVEENLRLLREYILEMEEEIKKFGLSEGNIPESKASSNEESPLKALKGELNEISKSLAEVNVKNVSEKVVANVVNKEVQTQEVQTQAISSPKETALVYPTKAKAESTPKKETEVTEIPTKAEISSEKENTEKKEVTREETKANKVEETEEKTEQPQESTQTTPQESVSSYAAPSIPPSPLPPQLAFLISQGNVTFDVSEFNNLVTVEDLIKAIYELVKSNAATVSQVKEAVSQIDKLYSEAKVKELIKQVAERIAK